MKDLYLDSNAHIPMSKKALQALIDFNDSPASHGHASSPSRIGQKTSAAIENAREKIAQLIGAKDKNQIFFTNGCTQACEWALDILAKIKTEPLSDITTSGMEHPAVEQAAKKAAKNSKYTNDKIKKFNVNQDGILDYDIDADKAVCIHIQNETGTIQDLNKIRSNFLLSDMSQSLGKIKIDLSTTPVDIAVFGGHKFGGPPGTGFMYLKNTEHWREFGTGSRYFMDIPGTPNVGLIVAMAAALDEAVETIDLRYKNMVEFNELLELGLNEMGFDIVGESANRVPNTTFARVPKSKFPAHGGFLLMNELSNINMYVGLGSACGSLYTNGSPLMVSLGRPAEGQEYIRISQWGEYGAHEARDILFAIQKILK